jgi:hypothetical protein
MTRNALLSFLRPDRRRHGLAAVLAAAVVTNSLGLGGLPSANAQSFDGSPEIRQVVGKELSSPRRSGSSNYTRSGGLFGGLFNRSSGDSKKTSEPYRKATPVPSDRDVNWQGVPYHDPTGNRTASSQPAPIRDPGASSRNLAQPSRTPAPGATLNGSTRSAIPTPPPIAQSTPRKLSSADTSSEMPQTSSDRPEPLSVSQSSRRPISTAPATPKRIETQPTLVQRSTTSSISSDSNSVELVPKVSRKVVTSAPAPAAPTKVTKSEVIAPKQTVVASESGSSRRPVAEPEVTPEKVEAAKAPAPQVVRQEVSQPAVEPAPPKAAPAPQIVAEKPAPAPETVATTSTTTMPLGEARQAPSSSSTTVKLGAPTTQSQVATNGGGMNLPSETGVRSASSRTQSDPNNTSSTGDLAGSSAPQLARMNTFGNNNDASRPAGSLSASGTPSVALHAISDRLPVDGQNETNDMLPTQQTSQFIANDDTFAPRSRTVTGPTAPQYHNAGYGQGSGSGQGNGYGQGSNQSVPSQSVMTPGQPYPNAMRDQFGNVTTNPTNVQTPAMNVAPNSNNSSTEMPGIRVLTSGPRQVMIRQTHAYEIRVENRSSVDAEGLIIRAHIPDWGDVVGQQVSRGDVSAATEESIRNLNWRIERLGAGQSETMLVKLKASRPGTHDLDVDWTIAPQKRVVQITVQEPQLALTIDGPDEVIYGQSKTYQIRVLNPGDGVAPAVVFTLSPDSSSPQSQKIGDIPAGKEAQFEVELTAQDLGDLKIHGLAIGDLELKAEADKTVRVLAADLEAILTGPETKYQDTEGLYQLELTNHGTTASENVIANLQLPTGVTYQGGLEGATMTDGQLRWKIASLTPGAVRKYQFRCRLDATGTHQFTFDCKGSAAGQTNVSLDTNVEAIADLVLSIVDPQAPAPIGEDVSYQIVIRNRGSKPAMDVKAVAQFSHGIEPKQISGHMGKVITGQVLIEPIARIDAGQEVRMTIVARAETGGHHRFRTEVRSGDTVLVAEEATHYLEAQNGRVSRKSGAGGNEFSIPLR